MDDKHVATIGFITGFMIVFVICISIMFYFSYTQYKTDDTNSSRYCDFLNNYFGIDINYNLTYDDYIHNNFSYIPHHVKFHIYPEREATNVSIKIDDECFKSGKLITSYTDNNSEVVFPMISSAKYNILIDGNKCGRYIYPIQSYYNITCGDIK